MEDLRSPAFKRAQAFERGIITLQREIDILARSSEELYKENQRLKKELKNRETN